MQKSIFTKRYKKFILKLKAARVEAGFKQGDVAKKLKIAQSVLSRMETGERRVDVVELQEFCKLYKKPYDYFLDLDTKKS